MKGVVGLTQSAILARRDAKPKQSGWRDQIRNAFREPAELRAFLGLEVEPEPEPVSEPGRFVMLVPRAFARRMRPGDPADPLLLQVLPDRREAAVVSGYVSDPVGDQASRKARGLLHKYQGRVLLITTGACAVHCRYCFRQEFPYATEHAGRWDTAVEYIAAHPDIDEVILSGGDPLMLSTARLEELTDRLRGIGHVARLRLHTRLPVVLPDRVTDRLCEWIAGLPWPVVVVIHANHAQEFDDEVDGALARLRRAGAHLLNQSVLLAGINDNTEALVALMQRSMTAHVLPYYLHLLDRVAGAARFESDQQTARQLHEAMRVRLSGYLVPRLVREQAGAPYKLPVI